MVEDSSINSKSKNKATRPKAVYLWTEADVQKWLRRHCSDYYNLYWERFHEETSDSISAFSDTCSNYTPPRQDTSSDESFLEEFETPKQLSPLKEVNKTCDKTPIIRNDLPLLQCVPLPDISTEPPKNLNNSDFSHQLATLMGHTNEVHKKSYRLPDDVYQTAKISKLLILMEDGKADAFKRKTLEEIDLDMNEELDEEVLDNDQILDYDCGPIETVNSDCIQQMCNQNNLSQAGPSGIQTSQQCVTEQITQVLNTKNKIKTGKKRTLVPWTPEQKKVVTKFFKLHIKNKQPPKNMNVKY
ncbi:unnamed protein product [Parnassius apollo]|uniref:(apollo) hypothetical protein n=1 Tax=Parnassius apollo TaxID=110799 RepID=A0A8S3W6K8_PARAO|nr:unnamed protein product [Parnassius apollo]